MPVDTLGIFKTILDAICWLEDKFTKMKEADGMHRQHYEDLKEMHGHIQKILPYVNRRYGTEDIEKIRTHLENAKKMIQEHADKTLAERFLRADVSLSYMRRANSEIKKARDQLNTFLNVTGLIMHCESISLLCQKMDLMVMIQENEDIGLRKISDSSVSPPPSPSGVTIREDKNNLVLSWKSCAGMVDGYEVCYDENNKCIKHVGKINEVEFSPPRVLPGNIYTMKVRGVNNGGAGEWSESVVGQFTKPFPQKPTIVRVSCKATTADVTAEIPKAACDTESPVTVMELAYVDALSKKWSCIYKEIGLVKKVCTISASNLKPETKYTFKIRTQNTEGWSEPSGVEKITTDKLPPKPDIPKPPLLVVAKKMKYISSWRCLEKCVIQNHPFYHGRYTALVQITLK